MSQKKISAIIYGVLVVMCMFVLGYLAGINQPSEEIKVFVSAPEQSAQTQHSADTAEVASVLSQQQTLSVIDLNTADENALQTLPGIGPELAERIIAYRDTIGEFVTKEQIMEVEGIGEKRYADMEALITVGGTP